MSLPFKFQFYEEKISPPTRSRFGSNGNIAFSFGYHLYEEITHEWLGLVFFALIISHLSLNTWWLKKTFSGSYNSYRILQSAVNFATFLLFLTACISGIMLSKHLLVEMLFHSTTDLM